jgi:HEAT repeat protein
MREPTVFGLHLARLLSQLLTAPDDDRAMHQIMDDLLGTTRGPVTLSWDNWQLVADGEPLAPSLSGVKDLTGRMAAHGLREIAFEAAPEPGEVMAALWVLARDPVPGDGGADAVMRLRKFSVSRVRFVAVAAPPSVIRATQSAAFDTAGGFGDSADPASGAILDGFELEDLDAIPENRPRARAEEEPPVTSAPRETPEEAATRLTEASSMEELASALETLSDGATAALKARDVKRAATLVARVMEAQEAAGAADARTAYTFHLRRVGKPELFREIAKELPRERENRSLFMKVLGYFGVDAVDALIEQLVYADQARERRILFDAIVELGLGVPTLVHMLDDHRWYVARNAAELLGRLGAAEAQPQLARAVEHEEPRVRRSAIAALGRIGTPAALSALRIAMRDADDEMRMQAITAVSLSREPAAAAVLLQALEHEEEVGIRTALIAGLGKIGTPEAVARLIDEASPPEGLFKRKHTATRLAAVQALAEARTAEAIATLRNLTSDKDAEVRDAATKGLASSPPVGAARSGWD